MRLVLSLQAYDLQDKVSVRLVLQEVDSDKRLKPLPYHWATTLDLDDGLSVREWVRDVLLGAVELM